MNEECTLARLTLFLSIGLLLCFAPSAARGQDDLKTPLCRADQLLAYYQGWGLSMAHDYVKIVVRNRSAITCQLQGFARIRQFDRHGKKLSGGSLGGCPKGPTREICEQLILKPGQRASSVISMLDGTGLDNPVCASQLKLDSPPGTDNWPRLTIDGIASCGGVGPGPLEYQTTPGVEIDPYARMQASFPRGLSVDGSSLDLVDAHAELGHSPGPYENGYDPPFELNLNGLLSSAAQTWCDAVTIELRGPGGDLLPRTPSPCVAPESRNPYLPNRSALTFYLYDVGFDLRSPGEYKLKVQWRLPTCEGPNENESCSVSSASGTKPIFVESNEITFKIKK
jgi:hypothetical protein